MLRIVAICLCLQSTAFAKAEHIDTLIEREIPNATVSILIKDAKTNTVIYQKNARKLLMPASSTKLFPAAASLYQFGVKHQFSTSVSKYGQDIYFTFTGSPSLTTNDLNTLVLSLKENNMNTIKGHIILDTTRFKPPYYTAGFQYNDLGWYYAAPDTAAILNNNLVSYEFISAKKIGQSIRIQQKDTYTGLTLTNKITTATQLDEQLHCTLDIDIQPNNTLTLYGCLAQSNQPKLMRLAVPDPILYAKQTIKALLKEHNIVFNDKLLDGKTPAHAKPIKTVYSDNLLLLVKEMLLNSNNLYANALTKQLGYALTEEGTTKQGIFAIQQILGKHTLVDFTKINLADGAGTRYNLISAEQLVNLLESIYQDEVLFPAFLSALPQAGVSGSLKDRMKNTVLEGHVFAKTGTLGDAVSLSGYLIRPHKPPLIFSIIINGLHNQKQTAEALEASILIAALTSAAQ